MNNFEKMSDPAFFSYLAGLIDGEGCFTLLVNANKVVSPRFSLQFRSDDWRVLRDLRERAGEIGTLRSQRGYTAQAPNGLASWYITKVGECQMLVKGIQLGSGLLTKKARDFWIWAEAIELILLHGGGINSPIRQELLDFREALSDIKRYNSELAIGYRDLLGASENRPKIQHPRHFSKLDADKVSEIRTLYSSGGITQTALAKKFGISVPHVNRIVHRSIQ